MARVAITEYAAKKLVLGEEYTGVTVTPESIKEAVDSLRFDGVFIVKIDVGIKKRGKQGLIRLNLKKEEVAEALTQLFMKGHVRCVIEEMVPHETEEEKYLSIDLGRDGAQVLYSPAGGVEIEDNHETIQRFFVPRADVLRGTSSVVIEGVPLDTLLSVMQQNHMSFIEINPFIVKNGLFTSSSRSQLGTTPLMDGQSDSFGGAESSASKEPLVPPQIGVGFFTPLDMAVEVDDSKAGKLGEWAQEHLIKHARSEAEKAVQKQDEMTTAALTLKILNKDGSILTLLSGGGASLVTMDALVTAGLQDQIINYSEYSGAPTRDETHAYVSTLLDVLFASTATKKVILIAGGVANFTDIMTTFTGIIDAFGEKITEIQKQNIYVLARRGGPNQEKGLASLRDFLTAHKIPNDVYDPSLLLGEVGTHIKKQI